MKPEGPSGVALFPLSRVDQFIALLIGAAFTGSIVGVVVYEEDLLPSELDFDVSWSTSTQDLQLPGQPVAGTGSVQFVVPVTQSNVTTVEIVVTVSSGATVPRAAAKSVAVAITPVTVQADSGTGSLAQASTAGATVTVGVSVQGVPTNNTLSAPSYSEANRTAQLRFGSIVGQGNWTVDVTISGGGVGDTEALTVSMVATVTSYSGMLNVRTPDVQV